MPVTAVTSRPPRSFWIISILALVWNLIGIATSLMSLTTSDEMLAAMPEAERALHTNVPAWQLSSDRLSRRGGLA